MRFSHWRHHHRWDDGYFGDYGDYGDYDYDYVPEWRYDNAWYTGAGYGGGWRGWY
jgi:hypothetical protein